MANTANTVDSSFQKLQNYHQKMEQVQPGYLQSKDRKILDRNFLEYLLKKNPRMNVDDWLHRNSLKSAGRYANKEVNKKWYERLGHEISRGAKNLLKAPFRLAYQLLRLLGAILTKIVDVVEEAMTGNRMPNGFDKKNYGPENGQHQKPDENLVIDANGQLVSQPARSARTTQGKNNGQKTTSKTPAAKIKMPSNVQKSRNAGQKNTPAKAKINHHQRGPQKMQPKGHSRGRKR